MGFMDKLWMGRALSRIYGIDPKKSGSAGGKEPPGIPWLSQRTGHFVFDRKGPNDDR
jgi:hypothetical protein